MQASEVDAAPTFCNGGVAAVVRARVVVPRWRCCGQVQEGPARLWPTNCCYDLLALFICLCLRSSRHSGAAGVHRCWRRVDAALAVLSEGETAVKVAAAGETEGCGVLCMLRCCLRERPPVLAAPVAVAAGLEILLLAAPACCMSPMPFQRDGCCPCLNAGWHVCFAGSSLCTLDACRACKPHPECHMNRVFDRAAHLLACSAICILPQCVAAVNWRSVVFRWPP